MITAIHYLIHRKPFTNPPEHATARTPEIIATITYQCGDVEKMEFPKYFPELGITVTGYESTAIFTSNRTDMRK
jgi:hypothetical protein